MSMECDTRLLMMAMRERTNRPQATRTPKINFRRYSATAVASMASFALTLFTRSA